MKNNISRLNPFPRKATSSYLRRRKNLQTSRNNPTVYEYRLKTVNNGLTNKGNSFPVQLNWHCLTGTSKCYKHQHERDTRGQVQRNTFCNQFKIFYLTSSCFCAQAIATLQSFSESILSFCLSFVVASSI